MDITRWRYDEPTGLLTNKLYADSKGTAYAYTPDGKLSTRTWARLAPGTGLPLQTLYSYNSSGALTGIAYSDATPAVTFTYDRLGRQVGVTQSGTGVPPVVYEYRYDPATLALDEEHFPDGTVLTRARDALGRPAGIALGSGYAAAYGYDAYGRFGHVAATVGTSVLTNTYSYLPGSHLLAGWSQTDANHAALSTVRTYEPHRDLLVAVTNFAGATVVSAFGYENDALGRRTARADSGTAFASTQANVFGYNARNEVANAAMRNGTSSYTHDPIGNRTTVVLPDEPAPIAYASNPLNQYTNIVLQGDAPSEPQHDADGNMLSGPAGPDRATLAMVWDAENRLIAVTNGDTVVLSDYDYRSRRIRKRVMESGTLTSEHRFLYDGWNLVRETIQNQQSAITNHFVWGLDLSGSLQGAGGIGGLLSLHCAGIDPATLQPFDPATLFYAYDGNGNVSDLVDPASAIRAHYEYSPFGELTTQSGDLAAANRLRFSTKRQDEATDLLYYGHRDLDSVWGMWLSRDPIAEAGGMNLYGFVGNDGVGNVDLLGKGSFEWGCCRCGPDVTAALDKTLKNIGEEFDDWSYRTKAAACFEIYNVWQKDGVSEVQMAWDIAPLYLIGQGEDASEQWDGVRDGTPEGDCTHTVSYRGLCIKAANLNYIMWGLVNRKCSDRFLLVPEDGMGQFAMLSALYYKGVVRDNAEALPEVMWAIGVGFGMSMSNDGVLSHRDCRPRAMNEVDGSSAFDWTWEPKRPRR